MAIVMENQQKFENFYPNEDQYKPPLRRNGIK